MQHPCLEVLEKEIDIQHTCGYVNLLRTGAPPQQEKSKGQNGTSRNRKKQPNAEEKAKQSEISNFLEDLKELGLDEPKKPAITEQSSAAQAGQQLQNGTGMASASHSDYTTGMENGTGNGGGGLYSEESMSPLQRKLLEEWVPLELSFGIPLFSDEANRTVCDKVCEHHMQVM